MVESKGDLPVPLHLRNAPSNLMKNIGYGKDYKYAHSFKGNFIPDKFLPEELKGNMFYNPGINQKEDEIRKRLAKMWDGFYDYQNNSGDI